MAGPRRKSEEMLRAIVQGVGEEIARERDLSTLLDLITRRAEELVGAASGTLQLWNPAVRVLELAAVHGLGDWVRDSPRRLGEGVAGAVAERRVGQIVNGYRESTQAKSIAVQHSPITAVLAEPLLYRERLLGVITVHHHDPGLRFAPSDQEAIRLLAVQAAIAIENARLFQEAQAQSDQLEAVQKVAEELTRELDLKRVLSLIAERVRMLLGTDRCTVRLWNEAGQYLDRVVWSGLAPVYADRPIRLDEGISGTVARRREPILINDYADFAGRIAQPHTPRAAIGCPLLYRDRFIGVIGSSHITSERAFTPDDLRLLQTFSRHAAIAIENARLFEAQQAQQAQLEGVRRIAEEITRELDLPRVLSLIAEHAQEMTRAESCIIRLWNEGEQLLEPAVWSGSPTIHTYRPLRLDEGVAGQVAATRIGRIVNDYARYSRALRMPEGAPAVSACLSIPLLYRERLVGVIVAINYSPNRQFTEADLTVLRLFSTQAAVAIENARLYQESERQRREAEIAADLSRQLNASLDLGTVLLRVAEAARALTDADLAQIALREAPEGPLIIRYQAGAHLNGYETHRIEPGKGVGGMVLCTGKPFRTANYAEDPRITKDYLPMTLAERVVVELAVPIRIEERVEGVLFVDNRSPRPFSDGDERTLVRLADHAAIAIRNAELHEAVVRRAQQLTFLNAVTQALTTTMDPQRVAEEILRATLELFPEAASRFWKIGPDGRKMLQVASVGLKDPSRWAQFEIGPLEGLLGLALATAEPVVCLDPIRDPRCSRPAWARDEGLRSSVVLPLAYGERVRGAVVISRRVRHEFSAEEMDLLRTFAVQAGIALQNAELFEEVQRGRWELWRLNQRIVTAQEEERRSLSRELHDEAGQALTALRIGLELIRQDLPAEARALHARLDEAVALAGSTTEQIRRMAQGLRPPALDTVGLDAALEELCRAFAAQTRLEVDYDGATLPPLPDLVGIHLYRCLQEALTNVARHARTDRAQVILQYDGETISLAVEDKGCGFEAATSSGGASSGGIGLAGMRERLDALRGSLEIVSRPGKGTRITASVPWREGE